MSELIFQYSLNFGYIFLRNHEDWVCYDLGVLIYAGNSIKTKVGGR